MVISKLDDTSHFYQNVAEKNLKKLQDNQYIASILVDNGNALVRNKKYQDAYKIYHEIAKYDSDLSQERIAYLQELPQKLFLKGNDALKIRPQYSYFAYKEAITMLSDDQEKLRKSIMIKLKTVMNILKRDDIEVVGL
jgi:hypothetical protein